MNSKIKITFCAALCASLLAGCAGNNSSAAENSAVSSDSQTVTSSVSDSSTDDSSETSSIDESNLTEEQIYNNMVERSLMDLGNLERMSKFIEKLENKQEVTIAFIGGSITADLCRMPWIFCSYIPPATV